MWMMKWYDSIENLTAQHLTKDNRRTTSKDQSNI